MVEMNSLGYKNLLRAFIRKDYHFSTFEGFIVDKKGQLILRHDVDFSVDHALQMAAMEKEAQQEGPTSGILQEIRENIEPEAEEPMEEAPQQEQPKGIMSRGAV